MKAREIVYANSYGDATTVTTRVHRQDLTEAIAAALEAERMAGREELFSQTYWAVRLKEARQAALEEAAKVADDFADRAKSNSMYPAFNTNQMANDGEYIADRIRQLKGER